MVPAEGPSAETSWPETDGPGLVAPRALRQYSLLADGIRGALLDDGGAVAWLCFPGWADQAVCAGLLGSGGLYRVAPAGRWVPGGFYEPGTLIWHSRWVTDDGIVTSADALAYPGEPDRAVLLRRISAEDRPTRIEIELSLAADYGRRPFGRPERSDDGTWHLEGPAGRARWSGAGGARLQPGPGGGGILTLEMVVRPGEPRDLVLEVARRPFADGPPDPDRCWDATRAAWEAAVPGGPYPVAHHDVRQSVAVLRGLTGPDGGTVAAATTSLPERAEAGRNYDYRYVWVRDTCYIGHAGASMPGGEALLDDAVRWVVDRLLADGDGTVPAYRVGGQPVPDQQRLGLPGYPGGSDRTGNQVRHQFQLDLFGEALLLLGAAAERDRLDGDGWRAAAEAVRALGRHWHRPESGIWELEPAWWTHSRLVAVAGLRAVAGAGAPVALSVEALSLADTIMGETDRRCLHPSGRWQRADGDQRVDAALLLADVRGALAPDDPRSRATRRAVATDLCEDDFLYRFRHRPGPLGDAEGAFLICNFWMALSCLGAGRREAAARWFERARAACANSGLYSEEYDVRQRQIRGNIPQAFVHALLIESACALGRS